MSFLNKTILSATLALFTFSTFISTLEAKPKETDASVSEKIKQLESELNQIKVQQRNNELDQEKQNEQNRNKPSVEIGSSGFKVQSSDKQFQLKIRGYIQADNRFYPDDTLGQQTHNFVLRRVRPIFEGTVFKYFDFRLMPDFGEGKTVLQDAYIDFKPKNEIKIRFGKFKEPIGLERLQSGTNTAFIERGFPTSLVPNRDLGVQIHGELFKSRVDYAVGVFNGVLDGGSTDSDSDDEKDFAGRVFVRPFKETSLKSLKGLGFGVAGTYGKQTGKVNNPQLPSFKTAGQQTFFSYRSDQTAPNTAFADGIHTRLSPQLYYSWGPVGILGEYVRSSQEVRRDKQQTTLTHQAWQAVASWVITGENATDQGVQPKKPINPKKGAWGAFELVGRFGQFIADKDSFPFFADPTKSTQKATGWGVGVNWYFNRNVRFALNYDQTHFKGGATAGNNRPTERAIFQRVQLAF